MCCHFSKHSCFEFLRTSSLFTSPVTAGTLSFPTPQAFIRKSIVLVWGWGGYRRQARESGYCFNLCAFSRRPGESNVLVFQPHLSTAVCNTPIDRLSCFTQVTSVNHLVTYCQLSDGAVCVHCPLSELFLCNTVLC